MPEGLDLSVAANDISFNDLPSLSSALKVANFFMHQCIDEPDCSQVVVPKHVSQNSKFVDDLNEEERQVADVVGGMNVEESGAMEYRELAVVGGTNVEEMTHLTVR